MTEREAFAALQAENARLMGLLESHGIAWRAPPAAASPPVPTASVQEPAPEAPRPSLSTAEKVALFRRLFRGRTDVYPVRWAGKISGKSGYAPACANEWRADVCEKPRIKCGDCSHRLLVPLSDSVIYDHLAGKQTVGVYPLLEDDTCHLLAVDFDEADWQQDAQAFMQSCDELGVPAALEILRSGRGAHAWVFFAGRVSARDARRLGTAIISHTCARTRQLRLASYDRLFPNQDTMPKGVFPDLNTRDDGYADRAPVGCYAANGYGLHDMIGNVWEWTRDAYGGARQPHGNGAPTQVAPRGDAAGVAMVIKGGSFLCAADYCVRYRAAARHPQEADLGVAHVGLRTVMPSR